jgi:hypothetical protein
MRLHVICELPKNSNVKNAFLILGYVCEGQGLGAIDKRDVMVVTSKSASSANYSAPSKATTFRFGFNKTPTDVPRTRFFLQNAQAGNFEPTSASTALDDANGRSRVVVRTHLT